MGKHILVITGGNVSIPFALRYLEELQFDMVIAVDSGLAYAHKLGLTIDYIVGDFDSVENEIINHYKNTGTKILAYNPVKDATDTELALELCVQLKAEKITLLGASGSRMDHTLANICLLYGLLEKNIKASIVDEHNKVYLIKEDTTLHKEKLHGPFISLLPFVNEVTGVSLIGFKYPLTDYTMKPYSSLGVSNEIIENTADIKLQSGILIVIEAKD